VKLIKKILKIGAIALLILIAIPLIIGQILRSMAATVPPPGEMVDVGGYKLHINCVAPKGSSGDELPTVIFEAGSGVSSPLYHWIQKGVSEKTRLCVYDRAGLGWSDESKLPRDAKTVTTALHTLLSKAEIKKPFVFVGHSIAGLYMRDYVERYPDDVAGLVFLDPSHPEQLKRMGLTEKQMADMIASVETQLSIVKWLNRLGVLEVYNPLTAGDLQTYPEDIRNQIEYLSKNSPYLDTTLRENADFKKAAVQAAENKSLGERPVIVFSATKPMPQGMLPEGVSPEKVLASFVELHDEITALSTQGKHIRIDTADHMSLITNKDNAAKVLPYIIEVVRQSGEKKNPVESLETSGKSAVKERE
jgi:pimeloyl-ACP methyl ester carboxylesterase